MVTILLIEDTVEVREEITTLLEFEGYRVLQAENGREGIEVAQRNIPDLILCDIMMPEKDGYEVLTTLREDLSTVRIPFIFLTARARKEEIRQGMNLGADDYIPKPFTVEELVSTIKTRLLRHEAIEAHYREEMHLAESKLNRAIFYNPVTELYNQEGFIHWAASAGDGQRDTVEYGFALFKIDRFNQLLTYLGVSSSNSLLKALAYRMVEESERGEMIFHVEMDEFAIYM